MSTYVSRHTLAVDADIARFVDDELLAGSGLDPDAVWAGFAALVDDLAPRNRQLLERRDELQRRIDGWHRANAGPGDPVAYRALLEELGYLVPAGAPFTVDTAGVDRELADVPAPQLVVPATNARYALNAANARWGSLYDALYGTDALGDPPPGGPYDRARGQRVIDWTKQFLDDAAAPLLAGCHADVVGYRIDDGRLHADLADGGSTMLADGTTLVGWTGTTAAPSTIVVEHHGLGVQLVIDADDPVGRDDPAHLADVRLEAAVSTIVDLEDSVATVDAADKLVGYRNWLGLLRGTLSAELVKDGRLLARSLHDDLVLESPGGQVTRAARALLLVRTVGHHVLTPAVRDGNGEPVPEHLLDMLVCVLCARDDALGRGARHRNSRTGSIYVVKPKLHGPDEVRFADTVAARIEQLLELPPHTVKLGIMDEERRTTLNLAECLRAVSGRLAFVNTGFLDRTGDEIHTSMHAGPMVRKAAMKQQRWLTAYEDWNIDTGLACGLRGRAQIGKGMWAAPDRMADMLRDKLGHPRAGANCAWVPSPTAATLHATHYHRVDVRQRQAELLDAVRRDGPRAALDDLLTIPVAEHADWSEQELRDELDNNAQGILGYVVRWVDQGIGCSKVPDIDDVALMEDRATCRISSQHIANWLFHGIITEEQVDDTFRRMATVVDRQNAGDPDHRPLAANPDGPAFRAARELVTHGASTSSGYTEHTLITARRARKELDAP